MTVIQKAGCKIPVDLLEIVKSFTSYAELLKKQLYSPEGKKKMYEGKGRLS